jgi:hypothetical protein
MVLILTIYPKSDSHDEILFAISKLELLPKVLAAMVVKRCGKI